MDKMEIGQALKRWRDTRGLSQRDLAAKSGVGYASIARIETGRQDPTVGMLTRLAEALGIRVVDFFTGPRGRRPAKRRARG
jgi:transcriptional regulator with XRE-family HTH domain